MRKNYLFIFLTLIVYNCPILNVLAEGTKQLEPSTRVGYETKFQFGSDRLRDFATYTSDTSKRLYIHIENPATEKIYLGFGSQFDLDNKSDLNDINGYFRVRNSRGDIIYGEQLIPESGAGYINNRQEAVSGPRGLNGGALGYEPIVIEPTPGVSGDYYIEFDRKGMNNTNWRVRLEYIDITVGDQSTLNAINGRLWAYMWSLVCVPPGQGQANKKSEASFYTYTTDSVVTKFSLNGMDPMGFGVMCNELGTNTSTNFVQSRRSVGGAENRAYPQFKIFLNDPDVSVYPSYNTDLFLDNAFYNGCDTDQSCNGITMVMRKAANVEILLDLNGVPGYQAGSEDVFIVRKLNAGKNCVPWNGRDGRGQRLSNRTINMSAKLYNGLTNFPIYDPENNADGLVVTSVRPKNPGQFLEVFWDDSGIDNPNNPMNVQRCTPASLTDGCHKWSNNFGNDRTINSWWYGSELIQNKELLIDPYPIAHGYVNDLFPCNVNSTIATNNSTPPNTEYTYTWKAVSLNNNFNSPNVIDAIVNTSSLTSSIDLSKITGLKGGDSIKYEVEINNLGCIIRDTLTIKVKPTSTVSIIGKEQVCPNTQGVSYWIQINDPDARIVSWTIPNNVTDVEPTILNKDTLKLNFGTTNASFGVEIAFNDQTCPKPVATKEVNIVPTPKAEPPVGKNEFCIKNDSIATYAITPVAGSTYQWSLSSPSKGNIIGADNQSRVRIEWNRFSGNKDTVLLRVKQTYSFNDGTSNQICNVQDSSLTITLLDPIKGSPMQDYNVCNESMLNISYPEFASQPTLARYIWQPNTGFTGNTDIYNPSLFLETDEGDTINYRLTVTKDGCIHRDTFKVIIRPDARIVSLDGLNPVCRNETDIIYTVVDKFANNRSWEVEGEESSTPSGNNISVNWGDISSTASVKVISESEFGCKDDNLKLPIDIVLYSNPAPLGDTILCEKLPALGGFKAASNNDGTAYTWGILPGVPDAEIQSLLQPDTINVNFTQDGTYTLWLFQHTVGREKCYANPDSVKVIVTEQAAISIIGNPEICEKDTSTLSINGNSQNVKFKWYALTSPNTSIEDSIYKVSPKASAVNYSYVAELIDPNCKARDTFELKVNPLPVIGFQNKVKEFCFEDNATLALEGPVGMSNYLWQPMNLTSTDVEIAKNTFTDNFEQRYISLFVIDANGCEQSDSVLLKTICDPRLFMPKSFSPNDDGYNDSLQWFGAHFKNFDIRIYNRWGEIIFQSNDKTMLWDGTYRGKAVEPGVYPWVLTYESLREKDPKNPRKQQGSITVVR